MSGRPTQFASKTGVGATGPFLCSNANAVLSISCVRHDDPTEMNACAEGAEFYHERVLRGGRDLLSITPPSFFLFFFFEFFIHTTHTTKAERTAE